MTTGHAAFAGKRRAGVVAVELLKKLIAEQVSIYRRTNLVKSEMFSEIIQSAMNRAGPKPGWYTVEIGWGSRQEMALWDLDVQTVEEVIPYFRTAYGRKSVDRAGFEDMSDMLG